MRTFYFDELRCAPLFFEIAPVLLIAVFLRALLLTLLRPFWGRAVKCCL